MNAQNMMKIGVLAAAMGMVSSGAFAATTAQQDVGLTVSQIDEIAAGGETVTLVVDTATAGEQPAAADDTTDESTLAITTNAASGSARGLTAQLDEAMETGATLTITVPDATGNGSGGTYDFVEATGTTAQAVGSGFYAIAETLTVDYDFEATVAAPAGDYSKQVTYTLTGIE